MNTSVRKTNTLLLPWESYLYLQRKERKERCGDCLKDEWIKRLKRGFDDLAKDGHKQIMDGDLGGCIGNPENAWEEGRWTSWTCEDMKRILDEAGLPYKDGDETEYIAISL